MQNHIKLYTLIKGELICLATSRTMTHAEYVNYWEDPNYSEYPDHYILALCSIDNDNIYYRSISEKMAIYFFINSRTILH